MGLFVHAPVHACNFPTMYCILHFDCQLLYSYVLSKASQYFLDLISCINPNSAVELVLMSWPQAMHFIYCKPVELLAFCGIPWHCRQAIIVIRPDKTSGRITMIVCLQCHGIPHIVCTIIAYPVRRCP